MNNEKMTEYTSLAEKYMSDFFASKESELKGIYDAMRYSVEIGGKRVRPLLTLMFCEAVGGNIKNAVPLACAVEFIHTYSLIHDDLPCMDDDDYRRGKLSNHKVFGEATAVLAGDALLTASFGLVTDGAEKGLYSNEIAVKAIQKLSYYAGASGMVGGQFIDLDGEGKAFPIETLRLMDKLKTGALIACACELGCLAGGADGEQIENAKIYAENIGLAFQIKDDILDVTGSLEKLGKLTGSDTENNKSTYVSLLGLNECEKLVDDMTQKAKTALDCFAFRDDLTEFADYLSKRDN